MNYHTDRTILFCVIIVLTFIEALKTLLKLFEKGIYKDKRQLLMDRTNKELRGLLVGVKGTSTLKKAQLVEKVLAYQA